MRLQGATLGPVGRKTVPDAKGKKDGDGANKTEWNTKSLAGSESKERGRLMSADSEGSSSEKERDRDS